MRHVVDANLSQFLGSRNRQSAQADRVQQLEDGRICTRAQRQRRNGDESKPRIRSKQ